MRLDPRGRERRLCASPLQQERRPRQVSLRSRAGQGRAREVPEAVEHEVARLPAREELRVEPVQALDLEEPVAEENHAARGMPGEPLGLMDDPREGREVERNLVYASVAKELERPYEEELG